MQVKDLFFATGGDVTEAQGQGGKHRGGELSPPLFRKNENKLNKNNLTKIPEPKIAPTQNLAARSQKKHLVCRLNKVG